MDSTLQKQILRSIWVVVSTAAILLAAYFLFPLIYPFVIGWLISYLMNPLVNLLQRKGRLPRWVSVSVSLVLFLGITTGLIVLLVTNIAIEIGTLSEEIQLHMDDWMTSITNYVQSDFIQSIVGRLSSFYSDYPQYQNTINNNLSSTVKQLADFGSNLIGAVLNGIVSFLTSLPTKATVTIISLLAAFFISKDWYKLQTRTADWFPSKARKAVGNVWLDLQKALFGYIRAQLILISITAVVIMIGLMVIGVNNAVAIGLLIGLCDLMPYLGVGAAMVPWIAYVFIQGDAYLGIGLSVLYGIVIVCRQLVEPKVLATSLGLEPLPLLIAMFVGLKLFNVIGLIIGPVTLIILFAVQRAGVFRDMLHYILKGKFVD